jgi:phosphoadenosine phosphosulfate reductase
MTLSGYKIRPHISKKEALILLPDQQNPAVALEQRYAQADAPDLLQALLTGEFAGRTALISSFGTESALLLALAAEIDRSVPVLFIDTGKLFPETLAYRDTLIQRLGLTNVRMITPSPVALDRRDPDGQLWYYDAEACCRLRKVEPLAISLDGIDLVISGRKRYHGALRLAMPRFQSVDGRIKVDPLAHWSQERVAAEFQRRALPPHPLQEEGYASVGCEPCTIPVGSGASPRAGRWAGATKTECGIHFALKPMAALAS